MSNYKYLVATDMDYTLIFPGKDVSPRNREAIKALQDRGVAFTIATGRSSYIVGKYTDTLNIDVPCITSNGGALFDPVQFKEVYSDNMNPDTVHELLTIAFDRDLDFTGYTSEYVYFSAVSDHKQFFFDYNEGTPEHLKAKIREITRADFEAHDYPPTSKILFVGADEKSVKEISERTDVEACFSAKDFLDIMNPGATKGKGLLKLAEIMGIDPKNTFALGDNDNDLSMIIDAQYGIAMGNSADHIKEHAQYVTTNCEEDGFAAAIFDYIIPTIDKLEGKA